MNNYPIEYARLADRIYSDKGGQFPTPPYSLNNWTLLATYEDKSTDYQGGLYRKDGTNQFAFVTRGTESPTDALEDIFMGFRSAPGQIASAKRFLLAAEAQARALTGDNFTIDLVGHSLGGAVTMALAAENGLNAYTFNAYGIGNLPGYSSLSADRPNIHNYVMYGDPVSSAVGSRFLGQTLAFGNPVDGQVPVYLAQHGIGAFLNYWYAETEGHPVTINNRFKVPLGLYGFTNASLLIDLVSKMTLASTTPCRNDPLVLDLSGDGQLDTLSDMAGANFDFDGNGFAEASGWINASDGFVVRDLNGNGSIDTGRELFGDQTLLPNGTLASNGFQAIAALDSNADGKVNAQDAAWSDLRMWRDADSDGMTDDGELLSMNDAGVGEINTANTTVNQSDANGNTLAQSGTFTRLDGMSGNAGSLLFDRDTTDSVATDWLGVPDAIAALPDIEGFGNVYTLRQAMVRDATLASLVTSLAASTDYSTLRAQFEAVLQRWTGADVAAAGSRGSFIDAKQLAVLEKFYGQGFVGVDGPNPNDAAAAQLTDAYSKLVDGLFAQYLPQAQLASIWDTVDFSWDETAATLVTGFSGAIPMMQTVLGSEPTVAVQLLWDFTRGVKQFGLDTSTEFAEFKAAFNDSPDYYDKVIQGALDGLVISVGSGVADAGALASGGLAFGLEGADVLSGSAGDDVLVGGGGNDALMGGAGADVLDGGAGNDWLGYSSSSGAESADEVNGDGNTYEGGKDNDHIAGSVAKDTYRYARGDGRDVINTHGGGDELNLGDIRVDEAGFTRNGDDLVIELPAGGAVTVSGWFDAGNARQLGLAKFADQALTAEELSNRVGTVLTQGNDVFVGEGSKAVIYGMEGSDWIEVAPGWGTMVFGGDGHDTLLWDREGIVGANEEGVYFDPGRGSDTVGTTPFADTIFIGNGDEECAVGLVSGSFVDRIIFAGPTSGTRSLLGTTVSCSREGDSVVIKASSGESVTLSHWLAQRNTNFTLVMPSGREITGTEFKAFMDGLIPASSPYNSPYSYAGYLEFGSDISPELLIMKNLANHDLIGEEYRISRMPYPQPPTKVTFRTVVGATSYSRGDASGTWASDAYLYLAGDPAMTIAEDDASTPDLLRMGPGVESSQTTLLRRGTDLVLAVGGLDAVTVQGWFATTDSCAKKIERVEFADGTAWSGVDLSSAALRVVGTNGDDSLSGLDDWNDHLTGGVGADTLSGGTGNDILDGGEGTDVLNGGADNDTLKPGAGDDMVDGGAGTDTVDMSEATVNLTLTPNNTGYQNTGSGSKKLLNIENFISGSGNDIIFGGAANNHYEGGAGNDQLNGGAGNDTLIGGEGADTLSGGVGDDTMTGGEGDDTYVVDATTDIVIESGTTAGDSVNTTAAYTMADGVEIGRAQSSCSRLTGNSGDNVIRDNTSLTVDTTFEGGTGNDTFYLNGGGSDIVDGGEGTDLLNLTFATFTTPPGVSLQNGANVLTFNGGSIAFSNIEQINFGVGADNISIDGNTNGLRILYSGDASAANTTNVGHYKNGSGWFIGGSLGNEDVTLENLSGSAWDSRGGNDIYRIVGSSVVTIADYSWNTSTGVFANGGQDTVSLESVDDLTQLTYVHFSDGSLELRDASGMKTKLYASNGMGVHNIERIAAPLLGLDMTVADFLQAVDDSQLQSSNATSSRGFFGFEDSFSFANTSGEEDIPETDSAPAISEQQAQSIMESASTESALRDPAAMLYGSDQGDLLQGSSLGETLLGGAGNDALVGGAGDDTYRYFSGDGYDTLTDAAGVADTLDFTDIDVASAQFFKVGNDLEVSLGTGQGVLVKNQFAAGGAVDFFLFGGQSYSASAINGMAGPRP